MIAASKLVLADTVSKVCAAFFHPLMDPLAVLLTAMLLSNLLFDQLGHIEMSFQTTEVSTFPLLLDYLGPGKMETSTWVLCFLRH
jgi:hypothetical protein